MDEIVQKYLSGLRLGETLQHANMAVFPLFSDLPEGPEYVSMSEALEKGWLKVTEVSSGGSVPNVAATNDADVAVLLLDGEELVGAKQNRVLNTTILLAAKSKTVIPVSCTERGRWAQVTHEFGDSDLVAFSRLRRDKIASVTQSVRQHGEYRSDQRQVWNRVDEAAAFLRARSATDAMRDVFEARKGEVDAYVDGISLQTGQRGLLAAVSGRVVGFDFISRPEVYARNHRKLVRSYAMDALLENSSSAAPSAELALAFLKDCLAAHGTVHPSVGLGQDHRLEGPGVVGSALTHEAVAIHIAFFRTEEGQVRETGMVGARRRAGFRRSG